LNITLQLQKLNFTFRWCMARSCQVFTSHWDLNCITSFLNGLKINEYKFERQTRTWLDHESIKTYSIICLSQSCINSETNLPIPLTPSCLFLWSVHLSSPLFLIIPEVSERQLSQSIELNPCLDASETQSEYPRCIKYLYWATYLWMHSNFTSYLCFLLLSTRNNRM